MRRRPTSFGPADILNSGKRIAILAGQGALPARDELTKLGDALGAPVAKSLLGKAVLADDSPLTTGGIGDLGTAPSFWAMKNCDTEDRPCLGKNTIPRRAKLAAFRSI
jgi:thiamine pyrophosphate-dependent acetolactate synthase large subunit-like protein